MTDVKKTTAVTNTEVNNTEEKIIPLTDDDCNRLMQKIIKADATEMNDIFRTYSNTITAILTMVIKNAQDDEDIVEIERIKRIINFAPIEEKFIRSKDKIWAVRHHILNKNLQYFMEKDYSAVIKRDHNQAMLEAIVEIIKNGIAKLSQDDLDFYWKKAALMLKCAARFKKAVGEYSN